MEVNWKKIKDCYIPEYIRNDEIQLMEYRKIESIRMKKEENWYLKIFPLDILIAIKDNFSVGKSMDNDLIINNPTISRHHLKFERKDGDFYLTDLGSSNHTFVNNKEIEEIKEIIKGQIDVEVKFDSPTTLGLHSITRSYKKDVGTSETTYHKGSLRSGQKIEVEGSLVVIGDVNSGAEVIAADNIIVVGTLRGLAHAGAKGNKEAIIAASTLDAVQLRISNIVKEIDRDEEEVHEHAYVYVDGDEIMIE